MDPAVNGLLWTAQMGVLWTELLQAAVARPLLAGTEIGVSDISDSELYPYYFCCISCKHTACDSSCVELTYVENINSIPLWWCDCTTMWSFSCYSFASMSGYLKKHCHGVNEITLEAESGIHVHHDLTSTMDHHSYPQDSFVSNSKKKQHPSWKMPGQWSGSLQWWVQICKNNTVMAKTKLNLVFFKLVLRSA